jgi:uncharacterized protein YbjT (DUF2867 family)
VTNILLAGATGLVGGTFLEQALANGAQITTVGRSATDRVEQEIITDFMAPLTLPAAEIAVCALGTTIAAAGSRKAFRAVDYAAVLAFATAAREAGVDHFITVSAVGANPRARVFYSRVKGEAEVALESIGFARLDILQPGLLLGPRDEHRSVEALLQRIDPITRLAMHGPLSRYAGIRAESVAAAIRALSMLTAAGTFRHDNRSMRRLAAEIDQTPR